MSEAIILYRGRGGVDPESLKPQVITNNGEYVAPVTGTYWIGAVGGGGGGGGGCMNAAGSGQFYGRGGNRGTLNSGSITLNAGDRITMSLGAGGAAGTNNTNKITYSNGCNNSMGTNGSTGGTTVFGSYKSGSGGTYGWRAWSDQQWENSLRWNNVPTQINSPTGYGCPYCNGFVSKIYGYTSDSHMLKYICSTGLNCPGRRSGGYWLTTNYATLIQNANRITWNNKQEWFNQKTHSIDGNTSIQQGTWWYQASNNQVSTSGTRTYRGDGGASGRVGNAGFIVIIPPTI